MTKGSFENLNSVFFIDNQVGWDVGLNGSIYKSEDGGKTWNQKNSNTTYNLNSVYFLDAQDGVAGGDKCHFLKTSDGGEKWVVDSLSGIPDPKANILSIYFANNLNGWIIASTDNAGWILHTNNGGMNWSVDLSANNQLLDMCFYSGNYGIVTGKNKTIYFTRDGITWNPADTIKIPTSVYQDRSDIKGVYLVNENIAYAVGWGSQSKNEPSMLLKSTNGGGDWNFLVQEENNRTYENLFDVYFKDENNGIAVGGAVLGSVILRTSDGGINWLKLEAPFGSQLNSVYGIGDEIWIAGYEGFICYSPDFGNTWDYETPIVNSTLYNLQFPTSQIGYATGFNGSMLKTTDGGKNWKSSYVSVDFTSLNIKDMFFINENVGYTASSYRMVSKTTDGGLTWTAIIPDTNSAYVVSSGLYFLNENLGFVVGRVSPNEDIIYKTTDGGLSWSTKTKIANQELYSVTFFDENTGIISGNKGALLYTTDGGELWNTSQVKNIPSGVNLAKLNGISFLNESTAVCVGQSVILRSIDAGATWDYIEDPKTTLNNVNFIDEKTGYAVGGNHILQTTDSGYLWFDISDSSVTGTLNDIAIDPSGNIWTCGSDGRIFTNKEFIPDAVNNKSYIKPDFSLSQNYPNPFNPATFIKYSTSEYGFVTLKVYDILGTLVKTLVNNYQEPGNYKVNFDASGLSSGIYIYSININGRLLTRKMSLIK